MKKELPYLVWNLFLFASIMASKLTGVSFPAVIVGIFAGMELAIWIVVLLSLGSKEVRDGVKRAIRVNVTSVIGESFMVFSAFYLGFVKIGCAWTMIALLVFSISASARKQE